MKTSKKNGKLKTNNKKRRKDKKTKETKDWKTERKDLRKKIKWLHRQKKIEVPRLIFKKRKKKKRQKRRNKKEARERARKEAKSEKKNQIAENKQRVEPVFAKRKWKWGKINSYKTKNKLKIT